MTIWEPFPVTGAPCKDASQTILEPSYCLGNESFQEATVSELMREGFQTSCSFKFEKGRYTGLIRGPTRRGAQSARYIVLVYDSVDTCSSGSSLLHQDNVRRGGGDLACR